MSDLRRKRELADNSIPRVDSAKTRTQKPNAAQLARIRRDAYTKALKRRAKRRAEEVKGNGQPQP